jgi:hypothetical protein
VFAPVVLLVLIQLKFLPYHHELVTWLHRGVIAADILLLWLFWGSIMRAANRGRFRSILALTGNVTLTIVVLLLVTLVATFPGEWLVDENVLATTRIFGTKSAYELLFSGDVNELKGTRERLGKHVGVAGQGFRRGRKARQGRYDYFAARARSTRRRLDSD